jgi:hypothetical protein
MRSAGARWLALVVACIALGVFFGVESSIDGGRRAYLAILAYLLAVAAGIVGGAMSIFRPTRRAGLRLVLGGVLLMSATGTAVSAIQSPHAGQP